jgi:uncharacterized phage protein (TIGR01671 family)
MREIKFRGMDALGVMRYGRLSQDAPDSTAYYKEFSQRICWTEGDAHVNVPVLNRTLAQYTGLHDKKGVEIYEGDICEQWGEPNFVVEWYEGGFIGKDVDGGKITPWDVTASPFPLVGAETSGTEVIGNIYENKELLDE